MTDEVHIVYYFKILINSQPWDLQRARKDVVD